MSWNPRSISNKTTGNHLCRYNYALKSTQLLFTPLNDSMRQRFPGLNHFHLVQLAITHYDDGRQLGWLPSYCCKFLWMVGSTRLMKRFRRCWSAMIKSGNTGDVQCAVPTKNRAFVVLICNIDFSKRSQKHFLGGSLFLHSSLCCDPSQHVQVFLKSFNGSTWYNWTEVCSHYSPPSNSTLS